MNAPRLYHFTCDHSAARLGRTGTLKPNRHVMLPELPPMVWLTDDPEPTREAVGLSSEYIECDRMKHRYRVIRTRHLQAWAEVRGRARVSIVDDLERFSRPECWWVSFGPVKVVRERISL